ncbi:type II secretion system pilot lipoprotein GspS-beta [Candidatus Photodesmus anomalopis]|uniref:type II secretion system pilot lipoprotein GspS-beta n=1 Tax=Candidatus Photodesmus anomalopis TaxID=28176 RepID=UPI0009DC441A|nr:type II secretion system pilot lipoprotein GspS-beta [Candidatus Photodesmus katoptron]
MKFLTDRQAILLNSVLPLKYGPLSISYAKSEKTTIEIMMIYNSKLLNSNQFIDQLMPIIIKNYCNSEQIRSNLNIGIRYRIIINNDDGQLIKEQYINKTICNE